MEHIKREVSAIAGGRSYQIHEDFKQTRELLNKRIDETHVWVANQRYQADVRLSSRLTMNARMQASHIIEDLFEDFKDDMDHLVAPSVTLRPVQAMRDASRAFDSLLAAAGRAWTSNDAYYGREERLVLAVDWCTEGAH